MVILAIIDATFASLGRGDGGKAGLNSPGVGWPRRALPNLLDAGHVRLPTRAEGRLKSPDRAGVCHVCTLISSTSSTKPIQIVPKANATEGINTTVGVKLK